MTFVLVHSNPEAECGLAVNGAMCLTDGPVLSQKIIMTVKLVKKTVRQLFVPINNTVSKEIVNAATATHIE